MPKTKKTKVEKGVGKAVKKTIEAVEKEIGKVTHYFDKIGVAVVELADDLGIGSLVRIKGVTTDLKQKIKSMQVEHKELKKAKKGQAIGIKVDDRVRPGDRVYIAEE